MLMIEIISAVSHLLLQQIGIYRIYCSERREELKYIQVTKNGDREEIKIVPNVS